MEREHFLFYKTNFAQPNWLLFRYDQLQSSSLYASDTVPFYDLHLKQNPGYLAHLSQSLLFKFHVDLQDIFMTSVIVKFQYKSNIWLLAFGG